MAIRIVIRNDSNSGVTDQKLADIAFCIELQLQGDLAYMYRTSGSIMERLDGLSVRAAHEVESLASDWRIEMNSKFDSLGCPIGGYHSVRGGIPFAEIATRRPGTREQLPLELISHCISHEALEMMANPLVIQWAQSSVFGTVAFEIADPVHELAYMIGGERGIMVSDFVGPRWFQPSLPPMLGVNFRLDHRGVLNKPGQFFKNESPHGGFITRLIDGKTYRQYADRRILIERNDNEERRRQWGEEHPEGILIAADAIAEAIRTGGNPATVVNALLGAGGAK